MPAATRWVALFFVISTTESCVAFFHPAAFSSFLESKSSLITSHSETPSCPTAFLVSTPRSIGFSLKRQRDRVSLLSLKASVHDLIISAEEGNSAAIEQLVQAGANIDGVIEDDHIQRAGYADEVT